jgi:hypothetical protein
MSRSLVNGAYALLVILALLFFWGRVSHWIESTPHIDAMAAFVTTIALLAAGLALTVRLVRERL